MYQISFIVVAIFGLLSACGGASTGTGSTGSSSSSSATYTPFVVPQKTYASDGSGVSVAGFPAPSRPYGHVMTTMILQDVSDGNKVVDTLRQAADGELVRVDTFSILGSDFAEKSQGLTSQGEPVTLFYTGNMLSGGSFVSTNIVLFGSDIVAFASDGSIIQNIVTTGNFSYSGLSSIIGVGADGLEDGTFSAIANFDAETLSISAQTTSGFLTANNLTIHTNVGRFDGSGQIGETGLNSNNASVMGFFAGTNAEGMHGSAWQDADVVGGYGAVFFGSR